MRPNRIKLKTVFFLVLLNSLCFSQAKTSCEKVFDTADTLAQYKNGKKDMHAYFQEKIIPILGDCIKQKLDVVHSMKIKFTIDLNGKVSAVEILEPTLSDYCKTKLITEFMQMQGWKPGIVSGNKVCSVFIYPVAGIRWQ